MTLPAPGFYTHYKQDPSGKENNYTYEVIGIGRNTEEGTLIVLYRPLYESEWMPPANFQSRPLEMFTGEVEKDGKRIPRFQMITNPEIIFRLEKVRDEMYK